MKRKLSILALFLILGIGLFAQKTVKPLRSAWYSAKQLQRRGYECNAYRGKIFMTYKRYLQLVNFKTVTK